MKDIELLKNLCNIPGAPGYEQKIRKFILNKIKEFQLDVTVDTLGNIVALKKGITDKKVMFAAHMDEIAFIVTHIDDSGFIRFHTLGGFDPKTLTAQRVWVHGKEDVIGVMGTKPIHSMSVEDRRRAPKISDYFIDTGLSGDKVKELIKVGDVITRERELVVMGDCVNAKSLDNRVSVYALIQILERLENETLPYDFFAVFTVQEEVGLRGAITSSSEINPDFAIALDVTISYDLPGAAAYESITKLGKGAAIKVLDGGTICDYRMVNFLKEISEKKDIPYQMEILPFGSTDTAGMQRSGKGGAIAGAISFPTRYLHQVIEMVHFDDVENVIELSIEALKEMDSYDWSFV